MSLLKGKCPQCNCELKIKSYSVKCEKCNFTASFNIEETKSELKLTPKELKALILLGAHAGKIILLYGSLKGIDCSKTTDVEKHNNFKRGEYRKLLNFYNGIASRCKDILQQKKMKITLKDILE